MDFVKKAMSGGGDKDKKEESTEQKQDYVDKAFQAGAKKAGYTVDDKTTEKITDAGREQFEKYTGKDVPDKVSN